MVPKLEIYDHHAIIIQGSWRKTWPWSCHDDGMVAAFLGVIMVSSMTTMSLSYRVSWQPWQTNMLSYTHDYVMLSVKDHVYAISEHDHYVWQWLSTRLDSQKCYVANNFLNIFAEIQSKTRISLTLRFVQFVKCLLLQVFVQ